MSHAYQLIDSKPNEIRRGELLSLRVNVENDSTITVILDYRASRILKETPPLFEIVYTQVGPNCAINWSNNHKVLENIDFIEIVCQDLREILLEQKQVLRFFEVDFCLKDSRILDCIKTSLNMRNQNIQIQNLTLEFCEANHFLDILLQVVPKNLTYVWLNCETESLEDFLLSENWKNFEGLEVRFRVRKVTSRSLEVIKKVFYNSTVFCTISIAFNEMEEHLEGGNFELPNSRESLKIEILETIFAQRRKRPLKNSQFTSTICTTEFNVTETHWAVLRVLENRIAMGMILKYLSFRDLVSLQKVSRGSRHCLDLLKLDPGFSKISIESTSSKRIRIDYSFKNQDDQICDYGKSNKGCTVNGLVINQWPHDTICNDLSQNLKFQKSCLEEFHLDIIHGTLTKQYELSLLHNSSLYQENGEKSIEQFLKSIFEHQTSLLAVKKLVIAPFNIFHSSASLKFFDSKFLETLEIRSMYNSNHKTDTGIDVLSNLEQWKSARNLVMRDFPISSEIRPEQFVHFSSVQVLVQNLSSDKIFEFKEVLLKSQHLDKFKFDFKHFSDENLAIMGPPFQRENDEMAEKRKIWYFRMTEQPEFALQIIYYIDKRVIFARVQIEMVPENAL